MVMYDNNMIIEFETKEKKIWTKDKIEPQQIYRDTKRRGVYLVLLTDAHGVVVLVFTKSVE